MSFMKKNAGFTLVELIVVIAILGILATVAIPSYNGYIEKAQIAGDQQELHNVNLAFAAACAEAGESNFGRSGVSVSTSGAAGSMKVTGLVDSEKVVENFQIYYPQADAGVFKYYTELFYDGNIGGFAPVNGGLMNATGYRKGYDDAAKDYYGSDNSYLGNEEDLLGTVGQFSNALGEFLTDADKMEKLLSDPTFKAFCDKYGYDTTDPNVVANAMVLYAAQELSDVNPSAIHSALVKSYNAETNRYDLLDMVDIMNGEDGSPADMALDGAALAAVIAGYANSDYASQDVKDYFNNNQGSVTNATSLFTYLNGVIGAGVTTDENGNKVDSFAEYLNSQAATDIEAFTGGLGAIYHGTDDLIDAANTSDEAFNQLLGEILSGSWTGAEG